MTGGEIGAILVFLYANAISTFNNDLPDIAILRNAERNQSVMRETTNPDHPKPTGETTVKITPMPDVEEVFAVRELQIKKQNYLEQLDF